MGTQYQITYSGHFVDQTEITELLDLINRSVNTYDSLSLIRHVNAAPAGSLDLSEYTQDLRSIFWENLAIAQEVWRESEGAFDPTVLPLVNYWGFGYEDEVDRPQEVPQQLQARIGLHHLNLDFTASRMAKSVSGVELDFSASAKGYAVDRVASLLANHGVQHFLVDIGGEMKCSGEGPSGGAWRIGVNRPAEDASMTDYEVILTLSNRALATSGNYRNYRSLSDGRKVSHSINPKTGVPERSDLLSATIVADQCSKADAWATACMILGTDAALTKIEALPDFEGFFITSDDAGTFTYVMTTGFEKLIQKENRR